jgi:hypothetical protein
LGAWKHFRVKEFLGAWEPSVAQKSLGVRRHLWVREPLTA